MEFEKNTLLFGADPTPRIVAVELGETGTVRVHRREPDGSTVTDVEPFHPFVWADSDVVDLGIETEKLRGDLKYGWLITVDSWKELIALRNGLKNAGRDFFAFTDPIQHYLTANGRTLFKDLAFEALKRMQIEVLFITGGGDSDHVMSIALSDNSGWQELIVVDANNVEESERNALSTYQRTRSGCNRRPRSIPRASAAARRPREEAEDQTRLGTQWRLSPFASLAIADCGEDYRLPEVHDRWPPFRRHVFAGAILRRRHAFSRRVRTDRCRPTFRSLRY